jgi:hypothetical protein
MNILAPEIGTLQVRLKKGNDDFLENVINDFNYI